MFAVVGGDARRAPKGVSLAVFMTCLKICLAPRRPNITVFIMFFAVGGKHHCIYCVCWPTRSKNTSLYTVFIMLQEAFFHARITKPK